MDGNMLCDRHNQRDFGLDGLFNGLGGLVPGYVDCRCIWFRFFLSLKLMSIRVVVIDRGGDIRTARTEGKTGRPRCSPSIPGFTPPTILVPHARDSLTLAVAYSCELVFRGESIAHRTCLPTLEC